MRQVAVVALLGALVAGCVAGMTPDQQARWDVAQARLITLAEENAALKHRFDSGELSVGEVQAALAKNAEAVHETVAEIKALREEGATTGALVAGAAGGAAGRSLLHGAARILPLLPLGPAAPLRPVIGWLLALILGGSATGKKDGAPKA